MSARSLFARALAAVAVAGVAIAAPVTGAGAATDDTATVSIAPIGVRVDLGTGPIVTIGGAPAPDSGITATVPIDGHATAAVGNPALSPAAAPLVGAVAPLVAPAAPLLAAAPSVDRIVDADVAVRVCVAVALLSGQPPLGCGLPLGSPAPTLADALAQVGLCARVAVLADGPLTRCGAGAEGGPNGTLPPSLVGLDTDAQVCLAATVLGVADGECPNADGTTDPADDPADDPAGPDVAGTVVDADVCLGLAVLTGADAAGCPAGSVVNPDDGSGDGLGVTPVSLTSVDDGTLGGSGADIDGVNGNAGGLAFTGADTMLLTLAGLGSVATGLALRRSARAHRAG